MTEYWLCALLFFGALTCNVSVISAMVTKTKKQEHISIGFAVGGLVVAIIAVALIMLVC